MVKVVEGCFGVCEELWSQAPNYEAKSMGLSVTGIGALLGTTLTTQSDTCGMSHCLPISLLSH